MRTALRTGAVLAAIGVIVMAGRLSATGPFHVAPWGDDANPGTASQPFLTIQRGVIAASASGVTAATCYVHPGYYAENVQIRSNKTGGWLVVRAASNHRPPLLAGWNSGNGITIEGVSRVEVRGFSISNYRRGVSVLNVTNIRVLRCRITDFREEFDGGLFIENSLASTYASNTITRTSVDSHRGITVNKNDNTFAVSNRIVGNRVFRCQHWGIVANEQGGNRQFHHNRIEGNLVYSNGSLYPWSVVMFKQHARSNIIVRNRIFANQGHAIALESLASSGIVACRIASNIIHDNGNNKGWDERGDGIALSEPWCCGEILDCVIERNAVFRNFQNGIRINKAQRTKVWHNTVLSNGRDSNDPYDGIRVENGANDTDIRNNIVAGTRIYGINLLGGSIPILRFNNVYGNQSGNYNGVTPGNGSLSSPSLFTSADPSSPDFLALESGSPEIDAGTNLTVYAFTGSAPDIGWRERLAVLPWSGPFYVATNGNDGNDGSFTAPFRTIQRAVLRMAPGTNVTAATCYILPGTYGGIVRIGTNGNPGWMAIVGYSNSRPPPRLATAATNQTRLSDVSRVLLAHLAVSNGQHGHGLVLLNATNIVCFRLLLTSAAGKTNRGIFVTNGRSLTFVSNVVSGYRVNIFTHNCRDSLWEGNTVRRSGLRGFVTGDVQMFSNNRIRYNRFLTNDATAIAILRNTYDGEVVGNLIVGNNHPGSGLELYNTASTGVITRVRVASNIITGYADGVAFNRNGTHPVTNCLLERNALVRNTRNGIRMRNGRDIRVWHNTILSNAFGDTNHGIWVATDSARADIRNNIVAGAKGGYGVTVSGGTVSFLRFNNVHGNAAGNYNGVTPQTGSLSLPVRFVSFDRSSPDFLRPAPGCGGIDAATNLGYAFAATGPDMGWKEAAPGNPDLRISKTVLKITNAPTVGGTKPAPGGLVTYLLAYTNLGLASATNVRLLDRPSTNLVYHTNILTNVSGWTAQFATNRTKPSMDWDSADFFLSPPPGGKTAVRWVRWRKRRVLVGETGTIIFQVLVR